MAAVIDLDVVPVPVPGAPVARARSALVAAVILALLCTLAGAAAPEPGLVPVLTLPDGVSNVVLTAGAVYTVGHGGIRADSLPGGRLLWRFPYAANVQQLLRDPATNTLIAQTDRDGVLGLDGGTGRELWRDATQSAVVVGVSGGHVLSRLDQVLRLADARTGQVIWQRDVDYTAYLGPDGEGVPDLLVGISPVGHVTVVDTATGSLRGEGDLGADFRDSNVRESVLGDFTEISMVAGTLYMARRLRGSDALTAFSTAPFGRRWRVGGPLGMLFPCGPVVCVAGTSDLSALDPATGAVRWEAPAYGIAGVYDEGTLFALENGESPPAALLDAATGRTLSRLGDTMQQGPVLLHFDRRVLGRVWVLRPGAGSLPEVAGRVDGLAALQCEATGGYLACPLVAGGFTVLRYSG